MGDEQGFNKIIQDISMLYELALTIGRYRDVDSSCHAFLSRLLGRKNLSFGAVWIKDEFLQRNATQKKVSLVFATPRYYIDKTHLDAEHQMFNLPARKKYSLAVSGRDNRFFDMVTEKALTAGSYAIYNLNEIGFLKLYSSSTENPFFSEIELEKLSSVIDIFAISLEQAVLKKQLLHEVGERKKAEERMRSSEMRYRAIVESQTELICRFKPDGTLTFVNEAYCRYFRKNPEELLGRTFMPLIPEDDHHIVLDYQQKINPANPIVEYEHRVILDDGEIRWQHWTDHAFFDEYGYAVEYQAVGRDITAQKKLEEHLKREMRFKELISDLSTYFMSLNEDQFDEGITYALEAFGRFFGFDTCYLSRVSDDGLSESITHEWCANDIEPQIDNNQNRPLDLDPWWAEQWRDRSYLYIYDVDSLPPEAEGAKKELQAEGIRSFLYAPVIKGSTLFGFLGFDAIREKRLWHEEDAMLLTLCTELISNALLRHQKDQDIRHLIFHDRLTGLYNRAFLEAEIKRLDTSRQLPISIIMADLNGLKLVNDTYGHARGDEMLKSAAAILNKSCREEDIIARWGGDEFVILLPQTDKNEARSIAERIADESSKAGLEGLPISFALGLSTKNIIDQDVLVLLREAEDEMYKRKLTESRSTKNLVMEALLKRLAEKSHETEEHIKCVQEVALKIGERINLTDTELNRLGLLVIMHDIGNINIARELLTKEDPLTDAEWARIKEHPEIGFRIARATEDFAHVAEDILAHHERWDGKGYPRGLKGEDIPLLARIIAIADAFEVMRSGRPYKQAMSRDEIIAEYKKCSCSQFDPGLTDIFLSILEEQ